MRRPSRLRPSHAARALLPAGGAQWATSVGLSGPGERTSRFRGSAQPPGGSSRRRPCRRQPVGHQVHTVSRPSISPQYLALRPRHHFTTTATITTPTMSPGGTTTYYLARLDTPTMCAITTSRHQHPQPPRWLGRQRRGGGWRVRARVVVPSVAQGSENPGALRRSVGAVKPVGVAVVAGSDDAAAFERQQVPVGTGTRADESAWPGVGQCMRPRSP